MPGARSSDGAARRSVLALVLGGGLAACAGTAAEAAAGPWVGDAHAAVRLITGADGVGTAPVLEAGLEFRFATGWHGYWRTPGDAGVGPQIDWSGSDNVAAAAVAWPAPRRLVVEGLQNSVYEGSVVLPVSLPLERAQAGARIRVTVGYAACSEICVPYQASLALDIGTGAATPSAEAAAIGAARTRVPGPPGEARIAVESAKILGTRLEHRLVVDLRSSGAPFAAPDLFVEGAGDGIPAAPLVDLEDNGRRARLTVQLADVKQPRTLVATLTDGDRAAEFSIPATTAPGAPGLGWLAALGSALLGGLILNLMPCVLPVLSIKLIGLVRHAGTGRNAIRLGLFATAIGIVASFGLIAAVMIGLKWSGATLGWGIQFQQPWFLALLATVTVLFAANFFDWLPIGLPHALMRLGGPRARGPLVEAFGTGMLATLLATPCSAPFVGTAVGFALAQGPSEIVAIFLCLGIGMALPYGAVALMPGLVRWLPRPGAWMLRLRHALGLLLLGTAAWLTILLWSASGPLVASLVAASLALLMAVAAQAGPSAGWRGSVAAVLAAAPILASLMLQPALSGATAAPGWQAFDQDALAGLVADGKTVLVDVSATWCLTCKVNELAALERPALRDRLARPGTIRMRADWSRPDPAIATYLQGFGRYGIPFDVVYGPGRPDGEALPELLTPDLVVEALDRATPAAAVPGENHP